MEIRFAIKKVESNIERLGGVIKQQLTSVIKGMNRKILTRKKIAVLYQV